MFFDGYGYHGTSFEQTYRCYPASFIDKLSCLPRLLTVLPRFILTTLCYLSSEMVLLSVFHIVGFWNLLLKKTMENLLLQEGDFVRVKNATLPKGTYVKLQPHTKDFLDISNPKAILETTLRNFSCLTTGDSIMVAYNNKKYYIDIIEAKPSHAISIIETDCEVDFAPPLDYKEPERPAVSIPTGKASAEGQEPPAGSEPKFNPFTGSGRRLDGKPLKTQPPPLSSSGSDKRPNGSGAGGTTTVSSSSSQSTNRQSQGKLVFGSNANRPGDPQKVFVRQDTKKEAKPEPPKNDEAEFQPFSGKRYSLRG